MSLTPGQLRAVKLLLESEDGEIVQDGLTCMVDLESISCATVNALLRHMAIKEVDYASAGSHIYVATPQARHILARPELADEIVARVLEGKPFAVTEDGRIVDA